MLFVILFVGTFIRAMLEAKGKSWAIMLKSYCTKIHSPTLSFRGIIVHFQIFIQDSGKKRRGQGIIWSKSHWSRQWISSSKKDRPKLGKKLKIYLLVVLFCLFTCSLPPSTLPIKSFLKAIVPNYQRGVYQLLKVCNVLTFPIMFSFGSAFSGECLSCIISNKKQVIFFLPRKMLFKSIKSYIFSAVIAFK